MPKMNDEQSLSASTSTVPESADDTPPERQILLILTPLANDVWSSTFSLQSLASSLLDLIKQRQSYNLTDQP
jgi:hypothetical protein